MTIPFYSRVLPPSRLSFCLMQFCYFSVFKNLICFCSQLSVSHVFSFPPFHWKTKEKEEQHESLNLERSIKQSFLLLWNKHLKQGKYSAFKKKKEGFFPTTKTFMFWGFFCWLVFHMKASDFHPAIKLCSYTLVCLRLELTDQGASSSVAKKRERQLCHITYSQSFTVTDILLASFFLHEQNTVQLPLQLHNRC